MNNNYILQIRLDYLGHFIAYGILGILGFSYAKSKQIRPRFAVTFLLAFAISTEFLQKLISWRSFNINDLVANIMGAGMSALGIIILLSINRKYRWIS